ncbi:MAG: PKD domain-containing protein, partial [Bacteroidetes bacterium]|nr:PKD domain-containing protein [Bacteroidota bacterium]
KKMAEEMKNPEFVKAYENAQRIIAENYNQKKGEINAKATVLRVPVVFHILHNGGPENISNEQVVDAINIWNADFRKLNADAATVHPDFTNLAADVEIEFVLATKAPNGACFSGITRTKSALANDGSNGSAQVNAIVQGNDVYNQTWPGNQYLNVLVCGVIGGAAGYVQGFSTFSANMTNGIWVRSDYVGSIGTGNLNRSRTLTHECGHWLGLPHCWGGNNNPGNASSCNTDDNIADTPNTIGVTACNLDEASCGPRANVENYMDYSYCSKMFTPGQVTRMRSVLTSTSGGRNNVYSPANIAATGADSNFVLCTAAFSTNSSTICKGETVQFTDQSFNSVSGWSWSFPGGSPATSAAQNPSVVYNTPGKYAVTLTATDGPTNKTTTKTNYITVLAEGINLPYQESFEGYTSLAAANSFFRVDPSLGNNTWQVYTGAGSTGNKCVRLKNFGMPAGTVTTMESNNFDLTNIGSSDVVTFSFKYAHRKRSAANNEVLRVTASNDCGESFSVRKTIANTSLSTQVVTSDWVPTSSDWVQTHVVNILNNYFVENMQLQFQFESDGGNNVYIDDINYYKGDPSKIGLEELSAVSNVSLYPNPADEMVNVSFEVATAGNVILEIKDLAGKTIGTYPIQATAGANMIMLNTSNYSQGMYLMNLQSAGSFKTIQFAVK